MTDQRFSENFFVWRHRLLRSVHSCRMGSRSQALTDRWYRTVPCLFPFLQRP